MLKQFLVDAKKATYAASGVEKKLPDGSKELTYKKGDLSYRDRYFGSRWFSGQEVVFDRKKPIWIMNYYGGTSKLLLVKEIYNFLKSALSNVPEDYPFRGPLKFSKGSWKYRNVVKGNLENFVGHEEIIYKNKLVYELEYHGGVVEK